MDPTVVVRLRAALEHSEAIRRQQQLELKHKENSETSLREQMRQLQHQCQSALEAKQDQLRSLKQESDREMAAVLRLLETSKMELHASTLDVQTSQRAARDAGARLQQAYMRINEMQQQRQAFAQSSEQTLHKLMQENKRLAERIAAAERENVLLKQAQSASCEVSRNLQAKLDGAHEASDEKTRELQQLQETAVELRRQVHDLMKRPDCSLEEYQQLHTQVDLSKAQLLQHEQALLSLRQQLSRLREQRQSLTLEAEAKNEQVQQLRSTIRDSLSTRSETLEKAEHRLQDYMREVGDLKLQLKSAQSSQSDIETSIHSTAGVCLRTIANTFAQLGLQRGDEWHVELDVDATKNLKELEKAIALVDDHIRSFLAQRNSAIDAERCRLEVLTTPA